MNQIRENVLFDRMREKAFLKDFLQSKLSTSLTIFGPSGVGKSTLVNSLLEEQKKISATFSFKVSEDEYFGNFELFLRSKYKLLRDPLNIKDTFGQLKKINFGFPILDWLKISISFSDTTAPIDEQYINQFVNLLQQKKIGVLYISNIELAKSQVDQNLIFYLLNIAKKKIKIIFEFGTLQDNTTFLKKIKQETDSHKVLKINPFDENLTEEFYKLKTNKIPPKNLFHNTNGIPLFIESHDDEITDPEPFNFVQNRFLSLSPESQYFLRTLQILGENATIDILESVYPNQNEFELVLNSLCLNRFVKQEDNKLRFHHAYYPTYIKANAIPHLEKKIHKAILKSLANSEDIDSLRSKCWHAESCEDWESFFENFLKLAPKLYEKELFWEVFCIGNDGLRFSKNQAPQQMKLLIFHCGVLSGRNEEALSFQKNNWPNGSKDILYSLMEAQLYYNRDLFSEAIKSCKKIISCGTLFHQAVSWSIITSCYLALDRKNDALDSYEAAMSISKMDNNSMLCGELIRVSPELEDHTLAEIKLREMIELTEIGNTPLLKAKCLHNLGVLQLLKLKGKKGRDHVEEAAIFFESTRHNYFSYSLLILSIFDFLEGNFKEFRNKLFDGYNLAFERYDRISFLNNIGVNYLLENDSEQAVYYLLKALEISASGLADPYYKYCVNFNMAVANLKLENFKEAEERLKMAKVPELAFDRDKREKRNTTLKELIAKKETNPSLILDGTSDDSWFADGYLVTFAFLSFYDFNLKILDGKNNSFL